MIKNWIEGNQKKFHSVKWPLLIIIVAASFHPLFEAIVTLTIVENLLVYFPRSLFNDCISIGVLILIPWYFRPTRKRLFAPNSLLIIFAIFLFYTYYRFFSDVWTFTPTYLFPYVKYTDLTYPFCIILLLTAKSKPNLSEADRGPFFSDLPISHESEDELGYTSYAKELVKLLDNTISQRAFAVGVNAKWGMGKTSFLDLVKNNLDREKYIVVDFNPWNSNSPTLIIDDFFKCLQANVRPHLPSLSNDLIKYSSVLSPIDNTGFTKLLSSTSSNNIDTAENLYDRINNDIDLLDKKLMVFIDDLDRLDKLEIMEVIRLIRNSANFKKTIFIVAFDRSYVLEAVKAHNPHNFDSFLEKIFLIEINLPYFRPGILRQKLFDRLKTFLPEEYHGDVEPAILGDTVFKTKQLDRWLLSMRDVTRLANSIALNFKQLQGEVVFSEFLKLELVRIRFPEVYELIYRKTDQVLQQHNNGTNRYAYELIPSQDNNKTNKFRIGEILRETFGSQITESNLTNAIEILKEVFGETDYNRRKELLSVVYPTNFPKYFSYTLLDGHLSVVEFSKYRRKDFKAFAEKISQWVSEGLASQLKERFYEIKHYDNREDFENVIKAILFLANQKVKSKYRSEPEHVLYDWTDFRDKVWDIEGRISSTIYLSDNGKEGLRNFIVTQLKNSQFPFLVEADLISKLINPSFEDFILPQSQLEELVVAYLRDYCALSSNVDRNMWSLFHCCQVGDFVPKDYRTIARGRYYISDAKAILVDFAFGKDLKGFLTSLIGGSMQRKGIYYLGEEVVVNIFDSWQNFKEQLEAHPSSSETFVVEFLQFFSEFEKNGFSEVAFDFKAITTPYS